MNLSEIISTHGVSACVIDWFQSSRLVSLKYLVENNEPLTASSIVMLIKPKSEPVGTSIYIAPPKGLAIIVSLFKIPNFFEITGNLAYEEADASMSVDPLRSK